MKLTLPLRVEVEEPEPGRRCALRFLSPDRVVTVMIDPHEAATLIEHYGEGPAHFPYSGGKR